MKFKFAYTGLLTACVLVALLFLAMGCGDAPTTPTPVIEPPVQVVVEPTPAPVAEPFCPFVVTDNLQASRNGDKLEVTFDVMFSPTGAYLKRYQVQIENVGTFEAEVKRLGGRHNKTATFELRNVGGDKLQVRAWYPNECHGDANHGARLNSPWSSWVEIKG